MNQRFTQLGLVSLAIVAGLPASAQTATTGALMGTVKDAKGLPVPGATVRITSGQISRTVVTNADGTFRLPLLNPGAMDISITKAGFSTINQKVDVSINETKTLNFKMVTEAEVTVVVAAQSVGVDTTTAQTGSNYSMDTIKSVPVSGRNMESLANLTPGVVASGMEDSRFGQSMSGASGSENSYIVDGLSTTDMRYGGSGTSLVTDFIDQVEVQTGAFKPEYSALGGIFNVVTKSGSNTFQGSAWLTYDPREWQAKPISTEWSGTQSSPLNRYDIGAAVSGPIIENKLFYFFGVSAQMSDSPEASVNLEGRAGSKRTVSDYQYVGKINWFATPDLQFTLFANYNPSKDKTDVDYARRGSANIGNTLDNHSKNFNLNIDWNISSSAILSAKIGESYLEANDHPSVPGARVDDWLWHEIGPGSVSTPGLPYPTNYARGGAGFFSESSVKTRQAKVDFSYFTMNHQFKVGFSQQDSEFKQNEYQGVAPTANAYGGNIRLYQDDDPDYPTQAEFFQVAFDNALSKSTVQAFYLQDTWEVIPGLKLSYGARFEKQSLRDSNSVDFLEFGFGDQFQPRLGIIWDPANDGQSKVMVNYARYHETFPLRYGLRYRGGRYLYKFTYYPVTYNTTDGSYSIDQRNQLNELDYSTAYNDPPVQEGIKPPERTEYVLGYERNLKDGWSVGIHGKFRELKNPVEDTTPVQPDGTYIDRGYQGFGQAVLANPRPGLWQWWTRPDSDSNTTDGVSQLMSWESDFREAYNRYAALDITLERKTASSYLNFSYTWSRLYGTYEGVVSASNQQIDTNGTQAFDYPIFVGYGPLSTDRTHVLKLNGSQNFTLGKGTLTLGANYSYYSGTPLSQLTANARTGVPPGDWTITRPFDYSYYSASIPVDFRYGQFGRSPNLSNLDLRVDYSFKVGKFQIVPSLDIYNAFNSRNATGLQNNYTLSWRGTLNPYWGYPTGYQIGRRYRAGIRLRF